MLRLLRLVAVLYRQLHDVVFKEPLSALQQVLLPQCHLTERHGIKVPSGENREPAGPRFFAFGQLRPKHTSGVLPIDGDVLPSHGAEHLHCTSHISHSDGQGIVQ
jgi:hypothetical protein